MRERENWQARLQWNKISTQWKTVSREGCFKTDCEKVFWNDLRDKKGFYKTHEELINNKEINNSIWKCARDLKRYFLKEDITGRKLLVVESDSFLCH